MTDAKAICEEARRKFHYDPDTGVFTHAVKVPTGSRKKPGDIAGSLGGEGYRYLFVFRKAYRANRLAWLYMTGEWPKHVVDHRDGDKTNDRWSNLRDVTQAVNSQNTRNRKLSASGYPGVYFDKYNFVARVYANRKTHHIGMFRTAEEANQACVAARTVLHVGAYA